MPEDKSWYNPESLGVRLVRDLVGQLDGTISLAIDGGTRVRVVFGTPEV